MMGLGEDSEEEEEKENDNVDQEQADIDNAGRLLTTCGKRLPAAMRQIGFQI